MSLFAAYQSGAPATPASLNDQLAGNLCRCTGYRPIVAAGLSTCDGAPADRFAATAEARTAALSALADGKDLFVGDEARFFAAPATLDSLAALTARFPDATLVAGATDVGLWITKQLRDLSRVIGLGRVAGLDAIGETAEGALSLGATVSLLDAAPHLAALHPDLGELMRRFGSVQVRTSGTVGGNIANGSPIGDLAPALIALGGRVVLCKGQAERALPLEDFFIAYGRQDRAPGEFVVAIEAPRLGANQRYRAFKVSKRFDEDISAVMLGARLDLDGRRIAGARIAYGGMAATPRRAANVERALLRVHLDAPESWDAALAALASDFQPLTDQRATAAYRMTAATNVLRKTLIEIAGAGPPTRLGALHAAE
jgi:xanthine dehydrogenase small subunit